MPLFSKHATTTAFTAAAMLSTMTAAQTLTANFDNSDATMGGSLVLTWVENDETSEFATIETTGNSIWFDTSILPESCILDDVSLVTSVSYHIHTTALDASPGIQDTCDVTGGHYDPHGEDEADALNADCVPGDSPDNAYCEVGDLSRRHSDVMSFGEYADAPEGSVQYEIAFGDWTDTTFDHFADVSEGGKGVTVHAVSDNEECNGQRIVCANFDAVEGEAASTGCVRRLRN